MLPRNSKSKNTGLHVKVQRLTAKIWKALKPDDLKDIAEKVKQKFKWEFEPRPFQLDAITAQLKREDVLIHSGTGTGKTVVAAGPHAHEKMEGKVTFLISPLIALQDEQVQTFHNEFHLEAIAVNSANGGCTKEVMDGIVAGRWQIVIISPESILLKKFIKGVIRNQEFSRRVLSVVVDEAHVVSHWGSDFRKKYGTLGILRALLPKGTPFVAMSATLPERVRKDILVKLQFNQDKYTFINMGNDRPNVSLVVRAIQNAMHTFTDLDFLIPPDTQSATDVRKGFVYADNVSGGLDMVDYLDSCLPTELQGTGLIRPYNAALSKDCRDLVMDLFKAGVVRILICTDAAGMGCNIPDIDIVVQWKLTSTVSSFVQRAGRVARAAGRTGLAILLVEKSVYEADLGHVNEDIQKPKGKKTTVRQLSNYPKAKTKDYATDRGLLRGAHGGMTDKITPGISVPIDLLSIDEGAHSFVQTTTCRRLVLTKIYGNKPAQPTVACCDICNPELLSLTRPAAPKSNTREKPVAYEVLNPSTHTTLSKWRTTIYERDFEGSIITDEGILSDGAIDKLSSVAKPITDLISLERTLGGWAWFGTYGDDLLAALMAIPFKSMGPKPKQKRETKRAATANIKDTTESVKKPRMEVQGQRLAPTPVRPMTASTSWSSSPATPNPITPMPPQYFANQPYSQPFTPMGYAYPQQYYYPARTQHQPPFLPLHYTPSHPPQTPMNHNPYYQLIAQQPCPQPPPQFPPPNPNAGPSHSG